MSISTEIPLILLYPPENCNIPIQNLGVPNFQQPKLLSSKLFEPPCSSVNGSHPLWGKQDFDELLASCKILSTLIPHCFPFAPTFPLPSSTSPPVLLAFVLSLVSQFSARVTPVTLRPCSYFSSLSLLISCLQKVVFLAYGGSRTPLVSILLPACSTVYLFTRELSFLTQVLLCSSPALGFSVSTGSSEVIPEAASYAEAKPTFREVPRSERPASVVAAPFTEADGLPSPAPVPVPGARAPPAACVVTAAAHNRSPALVSGPGAFESAHAYASPATVCPGAPALVPAPGTLVLLSATVPSRGHTGAFRSCCSKS